ncbi:hypothetical protein BYT27DRAFT_7175872 [Phlegmacium glaucopus]|nr:hypothetical protein BYT27DRAFT_7175872 [Phlegmacium glaucopus]
MTSDSAPPPAYLRTIYDETLRSRFYMNPCINSMANSPNLVGYLEHHAPTTDGSFSICVAGGEGVFISKALLESIPPEHRPTIDTDMNQTIDTLASGVLQSIGTTLIPFILTNMGTGEKFRIILYAIVVPNLFMNMFIGRRDLIASEAWRGGGPIFGFRLGEGDEETMVKGI